MTEIIKIIGVFVMLPYFGCRQGNVHQNEMHEQVKISLRLANGGNADEAVKIWNMGNLIDKYHDLRVIAPLEKRIKLLKNAAVSGQPEACFDYAVYNLDSLSNAPVFFEYLAKSSDHNYVASSVIYAIIEYLIYDNPNKAKEILNRASKSAPGKNTDVFDTSITKESVNLVMDAINVNGMAWLRVEAQKRNELELLGCIRLSDVYSTVNSTLEEAPLSTPRDTNSSSQTN